MIKPHNSLKEFASSELISNLIYRNEVIITINDKTYKGKVTKMTIETPIEPIYGLGQIGPYSKVVGPTVGKAEVQFTV